MNGHKFAEKRLASTNKEEEKEVLDFKNGECSLNLGDIVAQIIIKRALGQS